LQYGVEEMLEASPENVRVAYGVHPHFADQLDHGKLLFLKELLLRPNVCALGEIGLDYGPKNSCPRETQMRVFQLQLQLALSRQLPVCLHVRQAIEDGFTVLREVRGSAD
jgi:TatD DNase family protein